MFCLCIALITMKFCNTMIIIQSVDCIKVMHANDVVCHSESTLIVMNLSAGSALKKNYS